MIGQTAGGQREKTIDQDAPGSIFSRGWLVWYPPFSSSHARVEVFRTSIVLKLFARTKTMWILWKTAKRKNAVSHRLHIDHFSWRREEERTNDENHTAKLSTKSDQVQSPCFPPSVPDTDLLASISSCRVNSSGNGAIPSPSLRCPSRPVARSSAAKRSAPYYALVLRTRAPVAVRSRSGSLRRTAEASTSIGHRAVARE